MSKIILVCIVLTPFLSRANGVGNGGDICENRFKIVRSDIQSWILKAGAAGLQLPNGISENLYNSEMLNSMDLAKVSCTDEKLFIGLAEKTCQNSRQVDGSLLIKCNFHRFMETSESDQYVLVHHEYAGAANFEVNTNENSDYRISNQITYFLESQVVKKLVIKPAPTLPIAGSLSDQEADQKIMQSCETYKRLVNEKLINYVVSKGGVLHENFDVGTCARMVFTGGQPAVVLAYPHDFVTMAFSDGSLGTSLTFSAAVNNGDHADKIAFHFWWDKSPVYNNLGNLEGYNYRFLYDDASEADTSYSLVEHFYYYIKNTSSGVGIGGVGLNY